MRETLWEQVTRRDPVNKTARLVTSRSKDSPPSSALSPDFREMLDTPIDSICKCGQAYKLPKKEHCVSCHNRYLASGTESRELYRAKKRERRRNQSCINSIQGLENIRLK